MSRVLTKEMLEQALEQVMNPPPRDTSIVLSPRGYEMAQRVLEIKPKLKFRFEHEVWYWANELGLKERA